MLFSIKASVSWSSCDDMWRTWLPLLFGVIFLFGNYKGITLSDEYLYAARAVDLVQGDFEWTASAFDNRFGQLLPMAGFVWLFGTEPWVFVLWSAVAWLMLVGLGWFWAKRCIPEAAPIISWLLFLNPSLLFFGADVSHDLVMTAWSTGALYLLWLRQKEPLRPALKDAFLLVFFLSIAFLTKMAVIFLVPFVLMLLVYDLWKRQNRRFWWKSILLGSLFLLGFLVFYYWQKGDPFFRFRGIEAEHNAGEWSYAGKSSLELWLRATIYPVVFLWRSPGYSIPLLLCLPWCFRFQWRNLGQLPNFLACCLLITGATYWWGSTSFSYYNPMLLAERMWLQLIPLATILGGYTFFKVWKNPTDSDLRWLPYLYGVIGLCCLLIFLLFPEDSPYSYVSTWICLVLIIGLLRKIPFFWLSLLVLLPCFALQVVTFFGNRSSSYFAEYNFFKSLPTTEQHLILADTTLSKLPLSHLDFEPPSNISIRSWQNISDQELQQAEHIFLLKNDQRMEIERAYFKLAFPDWLNQVERATILQIKGLTIEEVGNRLPPPGMKKE